MKKILIIILIICSAGISYSIPNPWTECHNDMKCAGDKAGFNFPLRVNNHTIRAMKDMIEITLPLNSKKTVIIRKSQNSQGRADQNGTVDISGVYNTYPIDKTVYIYNVPFRVRGSKNKFFVVNFSAESGYYSFYCEYGLKIKDIKYLYKLLAEADAPRYNSEKPKTIEELMDSRRVDGIVEPVFTQDCFPRTLEKRGVTNECFYRINLGDDSFCSNSEIKIIKEYYKKGQNKDPLNNGSGNFCAD